MIKHVALTILIYPTLTTFAFSEDGLPPIRQARIIGGISDGRISQTAITLHASRDYSVLWSRKHMQQGRTVTINRIVPPITVSAGNLTTPVKGIDSEEFSYPAENSLPYGGCLMLTATTYDHKTTLVSFWQNGNWHQVWSNVDWNLLCGFHTFEGRGKRYDFFLLHSNIFTKHLDELEQRNIAITRPRPPRLPSVEENGACYNWDGSENVNEQALEFLEALHELYDVEKDRLIAAYQERVKNHKILQSQREELSRNPPPKPDLIINFWKRDSSKTEAQNSTKQQEGEQ